MKFYILICLSLFLIAHGHSNLFNPLFGNMFRDFNNDMLQNSLAFRNRMFRNSPLRTPRPTLIILPQVQHQQQMVTGSGFTMKWTRNGN